MGKFFGGSKSKSTNRGFESLQNTFNPLTNMSVASNQKAFDFLMGNNNSDFENFKKSTGFDFNLLRGIDANMANAASRGVVRSGARDKAIMEFGNNLQNNYAQSFVDRLMGIGNQGLQAAGTIAGAGGESTQSSSPGIGGLIGGLASGAATLKGGGLIKGKGGLGKGG